MKVWDWLVGMAAFLLIMLVITFSAYSYTKIQRSHIQQKHVGDSITGISCEIRSLDSSSLGNSLVDLG